MKRGWDERGLPSRHKIILFLVIAYVFVIGGIYVVGSLLEGKPAEYNVYGSLDERFVPDVTLEYQGRSYPYFSNQYTNILVIGVDQAQLNESTSRRNGGQADFLLLLAISRHNRTITPIHIDRDTITSVPVYGAFGDPAGSRDMQLCLSHSFGATQAECCENTLTAVRGLIHGIPIDYYLAMDMDGIAELNDALGGVIVTLTDDFSHLDPEMTAGATLTLKGRQAEYFVRGRYGIGDYTNRQRMTHQQDFIREALPRLYEMLEEDSRFVSDLFDQLSPHLCTNLQQSWLLNNSYSIENYEVTDIITLKGTHSIGETGFMEFHPDERALKEMLIDVFFSDPSAA